jgi:hypothetical protein
MTIRKGGGYGSGRSGGDVVPEAATDAELGVLVSEAFRAGEQHPVFRVTGGDLFRTLGGQTNLERGDGAELEVPVDIARCVLDGVDYLFVSHLVARRRFWSGRFVAVMNAEWLGSLDLGVRSHPGDGILDITEGRLPLRDRLVARRRARTGSHLPHPGLRTSRTGVYETTFDPPVTVRLDGVPRGRVRTLAIHVDPDAIVVII